MNATIPADLLEIKAQFEAWRQTRKARDPIPQERRQAAIKLLDRYAASTICRACRLHPRTLRTSFKPKSARAATPAKPATKERAFFQLPAPAPLPQIAPERSVVIERPDGSRLTFSLHSSDTVTLTTLCSEFLRS